MNNMIYFTRVKLLVLDFDGVLTDNFVYVDQTGVEQVRCSRADGIGIDQLRSLGIPTYIVSTEKNPVVSIRAKKLKVKCFQSVADKKEVVASIASDNCCDLHDVMFVGNDINDIAAMGIVGFPVAVKNSHPSVLALAKFITTRDGGEGAVREICDLIALSKNLNT